MMDRHREAFREEARELLAELEVALLDLEKKPDDEDLVGRVFRAMHTIKGSGAMFGFEEIASFTHGVETVYDLVRNRQVAVDGNLISLTLSACDQIQRMVDSPGEVGEADKTAVERISAAFRGLLPAGDANPSTVAVAPAGAERCTSGETSDNVTYRIRFRPSPDIFTSGTNPLLLLGELRGLGRCRITANTSEIPPLAELDPEACYTRWDVVLTTCQDINSIKDVFIFVEDESELQIDVIDRGAIMEEDENYKKLGEILVERGDVEAADLDRVLSSQKPIGKMLVDSGVVSPDKIQSALVEQQHVREVRRERKSTETAASVRVPAGKLDILVNLVGELVTVQSHLSQLASSGNTSELALVAEEVERLTDELRENTMSIRMLPIGTTFGKFNRLVRDLSAELGKDILLATEGGETELDKTVIERLNDPLIHIIRNSIDHGIEPPEIRERTGKPRQGTIRLAAEHAGANVLIRISDDGAGLDAEGIRAKAAEKGLIAPDSLPGEKEIFSLIFAPGFSLAKKITSVSGRGVGMDVVKKSIDALQGAIDIASVKGEGTAITLKLPLTLAIIDGLLVKIGAACFVLPLSAVEECVELTRQQVADAHGRNLASIRGELVPYINLRQHFGIGGKKPEIEQIVITQIGGYRVGIVVDEVIGECQTVIKPLGRFYRGMEEVSGATILGNGKVALILDLAKIVRKAEAEELGAPKGQQGNDQRSAGYEEISLN